jgi:tetratricopeptide (TPR) repeat protein
MARIGTAAGLAWCVCAAFAAAGSVQDPAETELAQLIEAERVEADRMRRHGELRGALRSFDELLEDDPDDALSRSLRALCRLEQGDPESALLDARRAVEDAEQGAPATRRACARTLSRLLLRAGRSAEALSALRQIESLLAPGSDARDAWALGQALWADGQREEARAVLDKGAQSRLDAPWEQLLAKARCERRLGFLERASHTLVAADDRARAAGGAEADVLVELGDIYFEADGEVELKAGRESPAVLYKQALEIHPAHEGAALGLFTLHRFNWRRQSRPADEILAELLRARPRSVPGLVAGVSADLDDGQLVSARARLESLRGLAPDLREVRTLEAALAWIEHRREECERLLGELNASDPGDGRPEREVGRTLCELYRFAEGLPFLRRAVEREPGDYDAWTQLGRALANTGDEKAGLEALQRSRELAGGRQNAWRHNTALVLERMLASSASLDRGELTFLWSPDAARVFEAYLVPFYEEAREELSRRYGFTPDPVKIEVFERHADFSVRTTGFEGFPALGVCFGPVVTAVSPLSELRGSFSWARTSFHEFTHVIHLGLSHNRCPRWITEGLATWEEVRRNPTWTRNMRRELVDAHANGDLIPVRALNRAFRGARILFGYYQGGLLCRMLVDKYGFPPMIRLLEAFDRGRDLDQACEAVLDTTPEEIDAEFQAFVAAEIAELAVEPRWSATTLASLSFSLASAPPEAPLEREAWEQGTCILAWAHWQAGEKIDAEQALRRLSKAGLQPARALFLQAEMALTRDDKELAKQLWQRGLETGGEDYRVRMALGKIAFGANELDLAREHFEAAERAFPGFDQREFSAELHLAQVHQLQGSEELMMRARERWLAYNAGEFALRIEVAGWHDRNGRFADSARLYGEANEVDPFSSKLHVDWGKALAELDRYAEALREFQVALIVPPELDLDSTGVRSDSQRAELIGRAALLLVELGRIEQAALEVDKALALDPKQTFALQARDRLQ